MECGRTVIFAPRAIPARRPASLVVVAFTLLGGACQSVPPVENTVARARYANDYGHHQQAADALQPIIDATPGVWQAEYEYGRAQMGLGNLEEARRSLERANARVPTNTEVIFTLAGCLAAQGRTAQLYELLRNAGVQLRSSEAWIRLAKYADQVGDPDTAMQSILAAIEIDDGFDARRSTECYWIASQLELKYGTREGSIRRLRQAYGVNPEDPRVRAALQEAGIQLDRTTALPPGR